MTKFDDEFAALMEAIAKKLNSTFLEDMKKFNEDKKFARNAPHFKRYFVELFGSEDARLDVKGWIVKNDGLIEEMGQGVKLVRIIYDPKSKVMSIHYEFSKLFPMLGKSETMMRTLFFAFVKRHKDMVADTKWSFNI